MREAHNCSHSILHQNLKCNPDTLQHLPPSFFIIGERKCATSSVYRYLLEHPQILPCRVKEPQFFSMPWWYRFLFTSRYRALFPKSTDRSIKIEWMDLDDAGKIVKEELTFQRDPKETIITGEASANTFAQVPPVRLKQAYPQAKLILCLRHPLDRAHSHYRMLERFAAEGRSIPFQIHDFATDFFDDLMRMKEGRDGYFAGISFYTDRLKRWAGVFGLNNIYIVRTEDLTRIESAQRILTEICHFLGLRDHDFRSVLSTRVNRSGPDAASDAELRRNLFNNFVDDVQALEEFTGRKFDWNP